MNGASSRPETSTIWNVPATSQAGLKAAAMLSSA